MFQLREPFQSVARASTELNLLLVITINLPGGLVASFEQDLHPSFPSSRWSESLDTAHLVSSLSTRPFPGKALDLYQPRHLVLFRVGRLELWSTNVHHDEFRKFLLVIRPELCRRYVQSTCLSARANPAPGLGVLFGKLQQGVQENQQVLTIARMRAEAEDLYGQRLGDIDAATMRVEGGFQKDDGASVKKVRHQSRV